MIRLTLLAFFRGARGSQNNLVKNLACGVHDKLVVHALAEDRVGKAPAWARDDPERCKQVIRPSRHMPKIMLTMRP